MNRSVLSMGRSRAARSARTASGRAGPAVREWRRAGLDRQAAVQPESSSANGIGGNDIARTPGERCADAEEPCEQPRPEPSRPRPSCLCQLPCLRLRRPPFLRAHRPRRPRLPWWLRRQQLPTLRRRPLSRPRRLWVIPKPRLARFPRRARCSKTASIPALSSGQTTGKDQPGTRAAHTE